MAPIVITDGQGHVIQLRSRRYRLPSLGATATERTNTIESITKILVYEGGISILEEAMALTANQFRQSTVGRDLPVGVENYI